MEKIIKDRLNYLKSELAQAKHQKLDKVNNEDYIKELDTRIHENGVILAKLTKSQEVGNKNKGIVVQKNGTGTGIRITSFPSRNIKPY